MTRFFFVAEDAVIAWGCQAPPYICDLDARHADFISGKEVAGDRVDEDTAIPEVTIGWDAVARRGMARGEIRQIDPAGWVVESSHNDFSDLSLGQAFPRWRRPSSGRYGTSTETPPRPTTSRGRRPASASLEHRSGGRSSYPSFRSSESETNSPVRSPGEFSRAYERERRSVGSTRGGYNAWMPTDFETYDGAESESGETTSSSSSQGNYTLRRRPQHVQGEGYHSSNDEALMMSEDFFETDAADVETEPDFARRREHQGHFTARYPDGFLDIDSGGECDDSSDDENGGAVFEDEVLTVTGRSVSMGGLRDISERAGEAILGVELEQQLYPLRGIPASGEETPSSDASSGSGSESC